MNKKIILISIIVITVIIIGIYLLFNNSSDNKNIDENYYKPDIVVSYSKLCTINLEQEEEFSLKFYITVDNNISSFTNNIDEFNRFSGLQSNWKIYGKDSDSITYNLILSGNVSGEPDIYILEFISNNKDCIIFIHLNILEIDNERPKGTYIMW